MRDLFNHLVRRSQNQQAPDAGTGQGLAHFGSVGVIVKNSPLHGLYPVLFAFGRCAGQNLRPFNQKAVIDDALALILMGYADGTVAFTGTAGAYKGNDFHKDPPVLFLLIYNHNILVAIT